ncbi:MAG: hypothetical protein IKJ16_05485 [Agathobacter sp.]|nr:hypothetical protein [Agathobacter sp.]
MKKKYSVRIIFVLVLVSVALAIMQFSVRKTSMEFAKEAEVCFIYGDVVVSQNMDDKEVETLKEIFDNKSLYKDTPSCGFSEDVSIQFNQSQTFCIARDTCPIVYWMEEDRYIRLTEEEKFLLYDLLEPYGFEFPCV